MSTLQLYDFKEKLYMDNIPTGRAPRVNQLHLVRGIQHKYPSHPDPASVPQVKHSNWRGALSVLTNLMELLHNRMTYTNIFKGI